MSGTTKALLASATAAALLTFLFVSPRRRRVSLAEEGLKRLVGGAAGWIARELQTP